MTLYLFTGYTTTNEWTSETGDDRMSAIRKFVVGLARAIAEPPAASCALCGDGGTVIMVSSIPNPSYPDQVAALKGTGPRIDGKWPTLQVMDPVPCPYCRDIPART